MEASAPPNVQAPPAGSAPPGDSTGAWGACRLPATHAGHLPSTGKHRTSCGQAEPALLDDGRPSTRCSTALYGVLPTVCGLLQAQPLRGVLSTPLQPGASIGGVRGSAHSDHLQRAIERLPVMWILRPWLAGCAPEPHDRCTRPRRIRLALQADMELHGWRAHALTCTILAGACLLATWVRFPASMRCADARIFVVNPGRQRALTHLHAQSHALAPPLAWMMPPRPCSRPTTPGPPAAALGVGAAPAAGGQLRRCHLTRAARSRGLGRGGVAAEELGGQPGPAPDLDGPAPGDSRPCRCHQRAGAVMPLRALAAVSSAHAFPWPPGLHGPLPEPEPPCWASQQPHQRVRSSQCGYSRGHVSREARPTRQTGRVWTSEPRAQQMRARQRNAPEGAVQHSRADFVVGMQRVGRTRPAQGTAGGQHVCRRPGEKRQRLERVSMARAARCVRAWVRGRSGAFHAVSTGSKPCPLGTGLW